ncbi:DUF3152 domain-containing protein [Streptomyces sp. NPDC057743]|uniref:DUF3152 domain-containing protein n=1 Tax=Streptomyces sp. NPDC057743 TaxID=3346236 RepID=UPI0036AEBBB8
MGKRHALRRRGGSRPRHARRPLARVLLAGCLLSGAFLGGAALAAWRTTAGPSDGRNSVSASLSPSDHLSSPAVPASGPGTFTTAQASGKVVGTSGPLRRYEVQVEDGVNVSAEQAALEVQTILSDPRSWAAHGKGRFQLVSSGGDVVIKIATPKTTDKLCAAVGDTGGELNCEVTGGVIVNLKRWVTGSPQYDGPPAEYRHLIINHETGHMIGYQQHTACPGSGKPAPVMMQQIKGLNGCKSNAWPYTADGTFVTGPPVG